jgi:acyl carrier protein
LKLNGLEGDIDMANTEIETKLTTIFRAVFDDPELAVTPALTADDVDGWDSLTHLRLILTVEKAFNVKFTVTEIGALNNVGELESLLDARLGTNSLRSHLS